MTPSPPSPQRAPLDRIAKRILASISTNVVDACAIGKLIGASEEVVRHRLAAMQEAGVLRGLHPRVDPALLGEAYECLVSGVPTDQTSRHAIDHLCSSAGVTRVFGMAAQHSLAFTVRGSDLATTQDRGLALARAAGLMQAQAVPIVNTFHDHGGMPWGEGPAAGQLA